MEIQGTNILVSGVLDGQGAEEIVRSMTARETYTLDFSDVSEVKFAALRTLLRCRQGGRRFVVINAVSDVADKFEDTGVSSFINVCRKPRPLDISQYQMFGESYMSKAYNSADGDAMIKVYGPKVSQAVAVREKVVARAVMKFGIPTPLVGAVYAGEEGTAIDFERIAGKRSLTRIISEEPERLEEMSRKFAGMCKQLHGTECDTAVFSNRRKQYRQDVLDCREFTGEDKAGILKFVDSIPEATTCLHGDMQPSNVITTGTEDLWIDLSDFGYGYPMLDMGMWYFLSNLRSDEQSMHLFHLSSDTMKEFWDIFIDEYFGAHTVESRAEITAMVEPYAALHMIHLGSQFWFEPGMTDYIREKLLRV